MNLPDQLQWRRVEELGQQLESMPRAHAAAQLQKLAAAGESPTVLTMLGNWLALPPAAPPLAAGSSLAGRYTLLEKLGEGGMGSVWRVKQAMISRDVALKMIHPALVTPSLRKQFVAEMEVLGRLDHPGIVKIFDAGVHDQDGQSIPFFVMELVDGTPLGSWAAAHRDDRATQLKVGCDICAALQSAHERNIVHRDLKPTNILMRPDGKPVVLDFGIARLAGIAVGDDTGLFSGTPAYAAPEQHLGRDRDFRSGESVDVYALGAILFEMLSGRRLFHFPRGTPISEIRRAVLEDRVPRLAEFIPECPPFLDEVVARALRRDPADRFYSMAGLGRALERAWGQLAAPTPVSSPWKPFPGALVPGTNWSLDHKLGEGGAGEVWSGVHTQLGERRVFKFCDTEEKARTLKRELTLFRLLKERVGRNPHFVQIHEVSLDDPPWYLMMDYTEAMDLDRWCASREGGLTALDLPAKLEIVAQAAEALQAAHEAGILHRDVKPSNILITTGPGSAIHVLIADFGIGQIIAAELVREGTRLGFTETVHGLQNSPLTGTMLYLAPEVLEGNPATARSDIYSLGIVLWQLITGNLHAALDAAGWADRIDDPLLRADLAKCLSGAPEKRWASAGDLAASIRALPDRRVADALRQAEILKRERIAYRRGLLRASLIAAATITILASLAFYAFHQSKLARQSRLLARLGEIAALRTSQAPGKRTESWNSILTEAPACPADLRDQFRNEAVAVLALPGASLAATSSFTFPRTFSSENLGTLARISPTGDITLLGKTHAGNWELSSRKPSGQHSWEKLVVTHNGRFVCGQGPGTNAAVWSDAGWIPIPGPFAPARIAVSGTGLLAIARPDGSIDMSRADSAQLTHLAELGREHAFPSPASVSTVVRPFPSVRPASILSFSPDSGLLVSCSSESLMVLVWNTRSTNLQAVGIHKHALTSVAWNPESKSEFATGAEDGVAILWNLGQLEPGLDRAKKLLLKPIVECAPPDPIKRVVRDLAYDGRGRSLYILYDDGSIAVFDAISGQFLDFLRLKDTRISSLALSGNRMGFIRDDQSVEIRDLALHQIFQETKVFRGPVTSVDTDDVGKLFLARAHEGCALLEPLSLRVLTSMDQAYGNTTRFNPGTGGLVSIAGGHILFRERNLSRSSPERVSFEKPAQAEGNEFVDVDAVSLDATTRMGAISMGGKITFKQTGKPALSPIIMFEHGTIRRHRLHPSGKWAVALANEAARPAAVATVGGSAAGELNVPPGNYWDLSFSPDGRFLALRDAKALRLLSVPDWSNLVSIELATRTGLDSPVEFSPDSQFLLATGPDAVPLLFQVPRVGEPGSKWPLFARLTPPVVRDIVSVRFGGPGRAFLLCGTRDGYLQSWNLASLSESLHAINLWDYPAAQLPAGYIPVQEIELREVSRENPVQ